jgi:hypothetical protein
MIETSTENRSRDTMLPIIAIVVFICLGTLCLLGVIGFFGFSFFGIRTNLSPSVAITTTAGPVMVTPPGGQSPALATSLAATATSMGVTIPTGDNLLSEIESGNLTIDNVPVIEADTATGPVLSIVISNPGTKDMDTHIPCGLILEPSVEGEQRMMVIQENDLTVPAGDSTSTDVFVACIDSDQSAPSGAGGYTVGTMAEGDLLTLAQCLCAQNIEAQASTDVTRLMAIQFAIWSVSDGLSLSEDMAGDAGGALGAYGEFMQMFMGSVIPQAEEILTQCGMNN